MSVWAQNAIVSVTDYGAYNNGTNASATTTAFKKAFSAAMNGKVIVPPGTYAIDNSAGPIVLSNFTGEFKFEGSARVVFQTSGQGGFTFSGGGSARVVGFRGGYASPSSKSGVAALAFSNTSNSQVDQVTIDSSSGVGIYFSNCTEPKVSNAHIQNTAAEGLRFDNNRAPEAANVAVIGAAGDGVLLYSASGTSGRDGGALTNITVENSTDKGISVIGQTRVNIANFLVDTVSSSGVYCAAESGSASPIEVQFQNGIISSAGSFGIEFQNPGSCTFANIEIKYAQGHAVYGSAPSGVMNFQNVRVRTSQTGNGFNVMNTSQIRVTESTVEDAAGYGFFFDSCGSILASGLKTYNVSKSNTLRRAMWFQNGTSVVAFNLTLMDDQSTATGYIVGTSGMKKGSLHSLNSNLSNGTMQVANNSSGVSVTMVN